VREVGEEDEGAGEGGGGHCGGGRDGGEGYIVVLCSSTGDLLHGLCARGAVIRSVVACSSKTPAGSRCGGSRQGCSVARDILTSRRLR